MKIIEKPVRPQNFTVEMSYDEFMAVYHFIGNTSQTYRQIHLGMSSEESEKLSSMYESMFRHLKTLGLQDE